MSAATAFARVYVLGLGLIGGSLARAFSALPGLTVMGWDRDPAAREAAQSSGAIAAALPPDAPEMATLDLVIIALPPAATIAEGLALFPRLRPGAWLLDICGVKRPIVAALAPAARAAGAHYLGTHPMAGREISGFGASKANLFAGASLLLCPEEENLPDALRDLLLGLGFARLVVTTPENHDRVIAFTSQLAHLVSSAYVRSPSALNFPGFTAGSFRDLSRVAGVDPNLWTELFLLNGDNVLRELDAIIGHLTAFREAVAAEDRAGLAALLREGSARKQALNHMEA